MRRPPRRKRPRSKILKIFKLLAGFLAILVLVVFVLSNRVPVLLSLWPFGGVNVWLGPVAVGALAAGFVLGLMAHLPRHFSLRRRARVAEKRVAQLTAERGSATTVV